MATKLNAEQEWPTIYVAIVALVGLAFLFSVKSVLSPVIAFIALILLISPWSGTRLHLLTTVTATFLLVVWLLDTLGTLLAPFILAFAFAYILDPLVDRLQRRGMKRGIAVAIVIVPFLIAFVLAIVFGIPALIEQIGNLVEHIPTALQRGVNWLEQLRTNAAQIPFLKGEALQRVLNNFSAERVAQFIAAKQAVIASHLWGTVLGVGKGITIALSIIGYLVLTPVLTIYLLSDFDSLMGKCGTLIPRDKRDSWVPFLTEYHQLLSGYLRGQFTEAVIVGVLTWLGLMILGFPYSGLVGFIAGLLNVIPYVGLVVSAIPAILIALLSGDIVSSLLKVAGVFFVVQLIDGTITGPRIVGGSVGLHPVWVILALAIGSSFFGFVGLLIAMPAAVFIKLLARNALARYRESRVYEGEPLPAE